MLIGARTAAWSGGGGWVNPYVTDGLVAMWDGEWNVKAGDPQDKTATSWKDIWGEQDDLVVMVEGDNVQWGDNCIVKTDNNHGYFNETSGALFNTKSNFSVECFATITKGRITPRNPLFSASAINNISAGTGIYGQWSGNVVYAFCSIERVNDDAKIVDINQNTTGLFSIDCDSQSYSAFYNGILARSNIPSGNSRRGDHLTLGSVLGYTNNASFEAIYSLRIYNKSLTEQQHLENYNVDVSRFT